MPEFRHAPMKRHHTQQPLSRDHYQGLVQSQHLIRAAVSDVAGRRKALTEFLDAWEREIEPHFQDEEQLLADLASPAEREQLLEEHRRLRGLADEARSRRKQVDPGAEWMPDLGQTLHAHIRWEERELFTSIETGAADQLDDLRSRADHIEAARPSPKHQHKGGT